MIFLQLSAASLLPVLVSGAFYLLERKSRFGKLSYRARQIVIGIVFGLVAICGTEFGVDVGGATANARDAAVLCAGLLFGAPAGIIAGVIGGAERWLATLWGAGEFSRIACTVATTLSGLYAAALRKYMFDDHRPTIGFGFAAGVVMEVIHLTVLFLTNLSNADAAFEIVKICTLPMVLCNAVSVMLASLLLTFLSKRRREKTEKKRRISQQVQIWLLVVIVLAYLSTTTFVYSLQSRLATKQADDLLRQSVADVRDDIERLSDAQILATAHAVASAYDADPGIDIFALCDKYDVDEIYVVNTEGIIVASNNAGTIGFDMSTGDQSGAFMGLLTENGPIELAQAYGPISFDGSMRKLAGVRLSFGFLQVALDSESFENSLAFLVKDVTGNRHMGQSGFIIIAEGDGRVVSNRSDKGVLDVGIGTLLLGQKRGVVFDAPLYGEACRCIYTVAEGYTILAALPDAEVFATRDMSVYINSFMEVIVFAVLFALIYSLIKRLVVNNIHIVNRDLGRIIGGDLDVVVDVHSSAEFSSLSNDINSTVSTLKQLISEAASRIDRELEFARSIQHAALPSVFPAFPDRKEFDIYATMDTAKEVGGDFYDFFALGRDKLGFLVADVSGKGIPAAMFMMTAKTLIKNLAESGLAPEEVVRRANDKLCEGNEAGMFVTAWFAVIDLPTGVVTYVNAGHNPPLLCRGGKFDYLRSRAGLVLAGMEGFPYKASTFTMEKGDRLFLYTDGVTEATSGALELFGEERLRSCLSANADRPLDALLGAVREDIDAFVGDAEQFDDITMLGFTYYGSGEDRQ